VLNILREFLRLRPGIRAAGPSLRSSAHGAGGHRRRVLDAYVQHPVATRAHVRGRWRTAPLASLDRWVPPAGRILEFGTGNGVVAVSLALQSPDRSVLAVDIDERRTGSAAAAVARMRLADRVDVLHVGDDWVPSPNSFDAVVVVDVLYLFGRARALEVLDALLAALRPNGVLVVKEMADSPRWKGRVNRFQEWVAVRGLGVTSGNVVDVIPAEDLAAHLRRRGCTVEVVALDSGYAHPHAVVVAHP
ncbi:MAG: SAM-dependent methyltransferase, partial [Actinomycetes bacterium]